MRPDERELDEEIRGHLGLCSKERSDLGEAPEAARFTWRAHCDWVKGTHSRIAVEDFHGLCEEQRHKRRFTYDEVQIILENLAQPDREVVGLRGGEVVRKLQPHDPTTPRPHDPLPQFLRRKLVQRLLGPIPPH